VRPAACRLLTAFALIAATFIAGEADVLANGDPASHVLPSREVFVPFDRSLCSPAGRRLDALTDATREAGYPIKVAVIPTAEDLGTLFRLYGRPQAYARQLASELPRELLNRDRFETQSRRRPLGLLARAEAGMPRHRYRTFVSLIGLRIPWHRADRSRSGGDACVRPVPRVAGPLTPRAGLKPRPRTPGAPRPRKRPHHTYMFGHSLRRQMRIRMWRQAGGREMCVDRREQTDVPAVTKLLQSPIFRYIPASISHGSDRGLRSFCER
jgi:hypothetical protein